MLATRSSLVAGLLAAALLGFGQAGWIHTKAMVAQWLLEGAWVRVRAGEPGARPWPWADTSPVAELTVPRLAEEVLVLDGASGRTLAFGPAHVAGSAPLGSVGNAILTGHRDTHFDFLRHLQTGDRIEVRDAGGEDSIYTVVSLAIAHVDELRLSVFALRPELTLVTCFPFDAVTPGGPWRYVVRAEVEGPVA